VFVSLPVVAMVEFFSDWAHMCDLLADVGICIELQKQKTKDKKICRRNKTGNAFVCTT